ncbi:MAG: hypothetical protein H6Q49_982 [Deltaproteobacteria bacterium]|nr:hypothetical protein [Deltaproteobacteria bacterium]
MAGGRSYTMKKIICFALGLSCEDVEKCRVSFYGADKEKSELEVIPIKEDMMALPVGEILGQVVAGGPGPNRMKEEQGEGSDCAYVQGKYRVVMVNTIEREQVLRVMRSFKAVLSDPQNVIFAIITDTALTWTFGEYIGHLASEHEYMKTRKSEAK